MQTTEIKQPKWADSEMLSGMKDKAMALAVDVKEKTGPSLMRVIDAVGSESQDKMVKANDMMQQSVGALLTGLDGKSPTADKLLELRHTFDELNPNALSNKWYFNWMPKGIKRNMVVKFAGKYQSMQSHVNGVMNGLRAGKDALLETSIELEVQYKEIEAAYQQIQADIYVGEKLFAEIEKMEAQTDTEDAAEVQKLASAKNKVARRVRDLRTKEQAALQFFISIDQTIASNELLSEQIDSALSVGPMVMTNALRIQAALARQETVKKAVAEFQDGLGELMADNAKAVNQAAQEIGDLYNNPVIALEKLQEGFNGLMEAVNTANETMANSTAKAREATAVLEDMSAQLSPVAEGLHAALEKGQEPESLETPAAVEDKS